MVRMHDIDTWNELFLITYLICEYKHSISTHEANSKQQHALVSGHVHIPILELTIICNGFEQCDSFIYMWDNRCNASSVVQLQMDWVICLKYVQFD